MGLSSRSNFIQPLISSIHCNVRKLDDEKSTGRTTKLHPASTTKSYFQVASDSDFIFCASISLTVLAVRL